MARDALSGGSAGIGAYWFVVVVVVVIVVVVAFVVFYGWKVCFVSVFVIFGVLGNSVFFC